MPGIRFTTARDLFEAFPAARHDIGAKPSDQPSLEFVGSLVEVGSWRDAIGFCAYLLPRREAVWWACVSIRALIKDRSPAEEATLRAAEAWVEEPEEHRRRAALETGSAGEREWAATWAALAAGYSGGFARQDQSAPAPPAPYQTARAVRAAVLVALSHVKIGARAAQAKPLIDQAIELAEGRATGL